MKSRAGAVRLQTVLCLALMAFLFSVGPGFGAGRGLWYASWTAAMMHNPLAALPGGSVRSVNIRQRVRISRGGTYVRILLSNRCGEYVLHIGAAAIGYRKARHGDVKRVPLRFAGKKAAFIPPGQVMFSDPVAVSAFAASPLPDNAVLEISLFLPDLTELSTIHFAAMDHLYIWGGNDQTLKSIPAPVRRATEAGTRLSRRLSWLPGMSFALNTAVAVLSPRAFLARVEVAGNPVSGTIVVLGDSIADGFGSSVGKNKRWPDDFSSLLHSHDLSYSIVNQGLSGNCLLRTCIGPSARDRFYRDVLTLPDVKYVVLRIGINDLTGSRIGLTPGQVLYPLSAGELISGYRYIVRQAHEKGIRVIGSTLIGAAGSGSYSPEMEKVRQAVNQEIRKGNIFDEVIDFAAIVGDGDKLDRYYDSGDHLHPNDRGYEKMARALFNQLNCSAKVHPKQICFRP